MWLGVDSFGADVPCIVQQVRESGASIGITCAQYLMNNCPRWSRIECKTTNEILFSTLSLSLFLFVYLLPVVSSLVVARHSFSTSLYRLLLLLRVVRWKQLWGKYGRDLGGNMPRGVSSLVWSTQCDGQGAAVRHFNHQRQTPERSFIFLCGLFAANATRP